MNKTAIKNFAIWARNKLIADICWALPKKGLRMHCRRVRGKLNSTILVQRSLICWMAMPSSSGGSL